ncbi:hypothetical protein N7471_013455 [Penicillium samsonianum]|uniref:uncharacterized protein n=1 Tax=Penicillium samsonianum TaxID=1882272 RepID=UPI0025486C0B|nr:uncharacterized protein N7471_013455 [Penicillium samsonianum]KAJ6118835.1 hypothetical protein N7471_013455 [Penicillium samsonianum]
MGLVESKVLLQKLQNICYEAETQGSTRIDVILQDTEASTPTIQLLKSSWTHLPEDARRIIVGNPPTQDTRITNTRITNGNTARKPAKRLKSSQPRPPRERKSATKAQICLSSSISSNISRWTKNPSDFFLDADETIVNFEAPALGFFYRSLLHFEHRRDNDLIRSRFLKVLFFKLKHKFGLQRLHSHSSDLLAKIILKSPLVGHDRDDIKENIIQWSKEGSKIDNLCRDIDDSSDDGYRYLWILFCLPEDVGKEYDLAHVIFENLWGCVESITLEIVQGSPLVTDQPSWHILAPNDGNSRETNVRLRGPESSIYEPNLLRRQNLASMPSPAQGLRWGSNSTRSTLLYQSSPDFSTASLNPQGLGRSTMDSIPGSNADSSASPEIQNGHIEPRGPLSDEVNSIQVPYDHRQFRYPIPQSPELPNPTLSDPPTTQVPYDHWQFRYPIPQSPELPNPTLSDPPTTQVPYDHWQFRYPIPQSPELPNPTLSDPPTTQVPYDHWQFRYPIPQSPELPNPTLSDPPATQVPYDHWQFRYPIPQSPELPNPTLSDPPTTQVPYDHWQFRYPIPQSPELPNPTLSDPPTTQVPYDHWQFRYPIPQSPELPNPTLSDPPATQVPYDHWQFRYPIPQSPELPNPTLSDPPTTQVPYDHWQFRYPIPQSPELPNPTLSDPPATQVPYDHWQFRYPIPQSPELPNPTLKDPPATQLPYEHWQFMTSVSDSFIA